MDGICVDMDEWFEHVLFTFYVIRTSKYIVYFSFYKFSTLSSVCFFFWHIKGTNFVHIHKIHNILQLHSSISIHEVYFVYGGFRSVCIHLYVLVCMCIVLWAQLISMVLKLIYLEASIFTGVGDVVTVEWVAFIHVYVQYYRIWIDRNSAATENVNTLIIVM